MLLQLKISELGGGGEIRHPQVQRVFKSPGKIGLKNCILGNFSIRIRKVSQFIDFFTGLKALQSN